jgi:hypothetical protein
MDKLFNELSNAKARNWTTSEEADISCHPSHSSGWLWIEDDFAVTQAGDKVEPIEDNLYRVTWNTELMATHGEFSVFTNLQHVLEILG